MPVVRRALRWAGLACAVVVLLAVILLAALHTPPGRRFAASQLTLILAGQHIEFRSENLSYNLLDLSLEVRNVIVRAARPAAPTFMTVDRLSADISLLALLRGRYVLQSGRASGVSVHYVVEEDGSDNLPRTPTDPDAPGEPLDYLIDMLQVSDARVRYENRAQQVDVVMPIAALTVDGSPLTDRHAVIIRAAGGTAHAEGQDVRLDGLSGRLDLGRDDVRFESLVLESEGSRAEVSGAMTTFDLPMLDLRLKADLDVERAAQLGGLEDPAGGRLVVDATAQGAANALKVAADLSGRGLRFRNVDQVALESAADYDVATGVATVEHLMLTAPWGAVAGNAVVAIKGGPSRASLRVNGVDAGQLMRALGVVQTAATRADGLVEAQWSALDYANASGTADLGLVPTQRQPGPSRMPVRGRVRVRANAGRAVAQLSDITAAGARVDGRIFLRDRTALGGRLRAAVPSLAATTAMFEAFLGRPAGALSPVPLSGAATADVSLGGTVSSPTAAASISAPDVDAGVVENIALSAQARYAADNAVLDRLDLAWAQSRLQASGRLSFTGAQPLSARFDLQSLRIADVLAAAGQRDVAADGILTASGTAGGTVARPRASATLRADGLMASNETLGTLQAAVDLDGQQVTVGRLVLDKPQPGSDGQLTASGHYAIDTGAYDFTVDSHDLSMVALTLPDGRPLRGDVALSGSGAGTIADPAAQLSVALDRLRLAQHDLGRVTLDGRLAERVAVVTGSADRFNTTADARIGIEQPYASTMKARLAVLDLAALPLAASAPLTGTVVADVAAAGDLANPAGGRAQATVTSVDATWNGRPFAHDGPANLAYAAERLTINRLELTARDTTVSIRGSLPLTDKDGAGAIDLTAHANLATLAEYAPSDMELAAQGTLDLTGTVRGTFARLEPDLTLLVADGAVTTPDLAPGLSNLSARARVADGAASVERLTASFGAALVELTASLPLSLLPEVPVEMPRATGDAQLHARLRDFDPGTAPGAPDDLSGRISLTADLSAARPELQAITGSVSFPELSVAFQGLALDQQGMSTVQLAGGVARISQFDLAGSAGTLRAGGSVGLSESAPLDVAVTGALNLGAIGTLGKGIRADGEAALDVTARGTVANPNLSGSVAISDVTVALDEPAIAVDGLTARVDLNGDRITLTSLEGQMNGGSISGNGGLAVRRGGIQDVDLRLTAEDVAMSAPLDLRSLSSANLQIGERDGRIVIGGKVTIKEAGLTGDIDFDAGALASLTGPRTLELTEERNATLQRIEFNVQIVTDTPVVVDNNLARAELTADLRLLGSPYETGLSGRLSVLEGGEIVLNERRFQVERGIITFVDDRRITPSLDTSLTTSASNYDVTLAITGEPGKTETNLTSSPVLPEPDILALLVTGRTLDEMRGEEGDVAKEQVLSYLGGRVGSRLGRGLERATGLSDVRIEPSLIANETDPSARLTIGQDLTDRLKLIYSTDLADSSDRVLAARYDVTRRFRTNAVNQSDGSYRLDFQHDIRKGGRPEPGRLPRLRPTISAIDIPVIDAVGEAELRDRLGLKVGDPLDYFAARDGVERIEKAMRERGYLEARVRLERTATDQSVAIVLRVHPGSEVDIAFTGVTPPSKVEDEVRRQWTRGVFDAQRGADAAGAVREWLIGDRFVAAKVDYRIEEVGPGARRVTFAATPGTRFSRIEVVFAGASGVSPDVLHDIVDEQKLELELFTDPVVVTELLRRYYREEGYLVAEVDTPRIAYDGTLARVVLEVREGPKFMVGVVSVSGNRVIGSPALLAELPVVPGEPFAPLAAANAQDRIRRLYWGRAYNDVESAYELRTNRDTGIVDVAFTIQEGAKSIVAGVVIDGNDRTGTRLVREQVALQTGQPLDLSTLGNSRRQMYDTGAFSIVDITRTPVVATDRPATDPAASPRVRLQDVPAHGEKPVRLDVVVREVQPFQVRYGASYDTERGLGGILDVSNRNSLGKAREIGLRTRYAARLREARLYMGQPSLRYAPTQTSASVYYREERNTESALLDAFNFDRYGASIQRERTLRNAYVWSYGYRYERARKFSAPGTSVLDETVAVAPLTSTFTRESRDEILDASTGSFTAHAFSYSPGWLGADRAYVKYSGQFLRYFALQPPTRKRFTNEVLRPRLVYAVGARVGLARGMGGEVPAAERFYAGGSTTLRGFAPNAVGPIGLDRIPTGGDMMLVLNNEIRVPLVGIFDGVGFLDTGNVFRRVTDFSFVDLRNTVGVGLRLRTPWLLIRGDYGVVLDPRPGEGRSRVYVSVGQAF